MKHIRLFFIIFILTKGSYSIKLNLECVCTQENCDVELLKVQEHETKMMQLEEPTNNFEPTLVSRNLFYEAGTEMSTIRTVVELNGLNMVRINLNGKAHDFYEGVDPTLSAVPMVFQKVLNNEQIDFFGPFSVNDIISKENVTFDIDLKPLGIVVLCDLYIQDNLFI